MINTQTKLPDRNTWEEKLRAWEIANADLDAEDVDTDELIDFYVEASSQALRDVLLFPVDFAGGLAVKMHLFRQNECHNWEQSEFDEIWSVMIEDLKRIGGR